MRNNTISNLYFDRYYNIIAINRSLYFRDKNIDFLRYYNIYFN